MRRFVGWVGVFVLAQTMQGCASRVVPARLYALDRPERSTMTFQFSGERNGIARAILLSGETLTGEFVIWAERTGAMTAEDWESVEQTAKGELSGRETTEWPVVYGYGSKSKEADPVGSAVLIGNSGTSLEVVLYHAVYDNPIVGDGLARDNKGNWYRVMIGNLD